MKAHFIVPKLNGITSIFWVPWPRLIACFMHTENYVIVTMSEDCLLMVLNDEAFEALSLENYQPV